ncbi:MAG: GAF domain-containing protein [Bacteroidales bacterium]|nr:GAF domain-containing protein [Bacteroidales bacterium]
MESLNVCKGSKREKYQSLLPQIASLVEGENDIIANMANISSAIHHTFDNLWTGFYIVRPDSSPSGETLVLGPFQGPLACTRIAYGKGVCGTSWKEMKTIIVQDVELFPGHIACSSLSRSEIVVPLIREGKVIAVLDIDSSEIGSYDDTDREFLERILDNIKSEM